MREIKFRAFNLGTKQWIYFALADKKGNLSVQFVQLDDDLWAQPEDTKTFYTALTEYTGLKDKNGVAIYEGDILATYSDDPDTDMWERDEWGYSECYFNIEDARFAFKNWSPTGEESSVFYWKYVEVIGNIYENPELLK